MSTKWQWDIKTHQSQWTSSQACKQYRGEGGWRKRSPLCYLWQQPVNSKWLKKKKNYQGEQSLQFAFPHGGLYVSQENHWWKAHAPQATPVHQGVPSSTPRSQDTPQQNLHPERQLKQDVAPEYSGPCLTHWKLPLKLGNYDPGNHRGGPWRIPHEGQSVGRWRL